ncbi:hypothetical protein [Oceanobacillus caeni]|uniref:hypothetical protein n=1 Tax=Oceanobacillus caeni TaxID=405946 RepID=UPI0036D3F7C9
MGWARIVQMIILWFLYLIGITAFGFGILLIYWQQWFGVIACFAVSGFILWASSIIKKSNKMYSDIDLKCELQEEGYYTYVQNKKNKRGVETIRSIRTNARSIDRSDNPLSV